MGAQPSLGGDELRARHHLHALSVRPIGHQEPTMNEPQPESAPVTPTRIIPAGTPLPERPPEPGELPPWWEKRTAPPPAPPPPVLPGQPAPDPGPVEIHHTHEVVLTWAEPDPEPSRWERLRAWLGQYVRPWHAALGLALAVVPIPGVGYSSATVWHYTVGEARDGFGVAIGYAVGLIPLLLDVTLTVRHGSSPLRLFALAVTGIGAFAALSWYDPVQFLTGVQR